MPTSANALPVAPQQFGISKEVTKGTFVAASATCRWTPSPLKTRSPCSPTSGCGDR